MKARPVGNAVGQPQLAAVRCRLGRWVGEQDALAAAVRLFVGKDVGEGVLHVVDRPESAETDQPVLRDPRGRKDAGVHARVAIIGPLRTLMVPRLGQLGQESSRRNVKDPGLVVIVVGDRVERHDLDPRRGPPACDQALRVIPVAGPVGKFDVGAVEAVAERKRRADRQRPVHFDSQRSETVEIGDERSAGLVAWAAQRQIDDAARRGERIALGRQSDLDAGRIEDGAGKVVHLVEIEAVDPDVARGRGRKSPRIAGIVDAEALAADAEPEGVLGLRHRIFVGSGLAVCRTRSARHRGRHQCQPGTRP